MNCIECKTAFHKACVQGFLDQVAPERKDVMEKLDKGDVMCVRCLVRQPQSGALTGNYDKAEYLPWACS